jgi:hypothetical protein
MFSFRLVPVIVIKVPPTEGPELGETDAMDGAELATERATRNPTLMNAERGATPVRPEARAPPEAEKYEPPRAARNAPDNGPRGFVDGLDA